VIGNDVHTSRDLCGHTDVISDMDIDGFTLASASWDNTVRLWQF
jgi:WD40 repeat protein